MTSYQSPISNTRDPTANPDSQTSIKPTIPPASPSINTSGGAATTPASANLTGPAYHRRAPPSSIYATDGSAASSAPPSGITSYNHVPWSSAIDSASASVATIEMFGEERITAYVGSRVDANPQYQHPSAEASIAAHIGAMRSVLDWIDVVMAGIGSGNPEKK